MAHFWLIFSVVQAGLSLAGVIAVLRRRTDPAAMMAWILAIVLLPILGVLLYLLISPVRVRRRLTRRRRKVAHLIEKVDREAQARLDADAPAPRGRLSGELAMIEQLGRTMVQIPATGGNAVEVYEDATAIYAALEAAIVAARHHVHLQYYIWQPDDTGLRFRELVVSKAREGVHCRVLLDAVGCIGTPTSFVRPMIDAGAEVAFFMPLLRFRKRWAPHLRNHRKIAVIDGDTAFVGSQNIGDEYLGRLKRLSPWYDSHIRIIGPAALALQQTFCEDWALATECALSGGEYFPTPRRPGSSIVQILPSGPDSDISVLGQIMFAAVAAAKDSIRIATPYFVPYAALRMALLHARARGVRVRLVVPAKSDNWLVRWACRSYYAEFVEAGVEVHEFEGGMLHSKMMAIDESFCLVGSANMDVRSFRLNFEATAMIYDADVTRQVVELIDGHLRESRRILPRDVFTQKWPAQLAEGAARLFSPLL